MAGLGSILAQASSPTQPPPLARYGHKNAPEWGTLPEAREWGALQKLVWRRARTATIRAPLLPLRSYCPLEASLAPRPHRHDPCAPLDAAKGQ